MKESFYWGRASTVVQSGVTDINSNVLQNYKRSGLQLHRTVVTLGKNGGNVSAIVPNEKYKSIKEFFDLGEYQELLDLYLPYAFREEILDSENLFFLTRSMLILKRKEEALGVLKINKSILIHHRVLMFEYILLCAQEGDYHSMREGIKDCEGRFGRDGIHSKILQALIHSNSSLDHYISKMKARYKINAPYEILRAAYPPRNKSLMLEYLPLVSNDPRHKVLELRTYLFLGKRKKAIEILNKINPIHYTKTQARDIIRILLQVHSDLSLDTWVKVAEMSQETIQLEFARNQLSVGISEGDFSIGLQGLKLLLQSENPSRTQILRLIRLGEDYKTVFESFMEIAGSNGFMLQLIVEFGIKYSFEEISLKALFRLESLMLCDLDKGDYQINYINGVKNSGDVSFMERAYNQLEYVPNPGPCVFRFASYFSEISTTFKFESIEKNYIDVNGIEHYVLRKIAQDFSSSTPKYTPIKSHVLVVNNSLKFGGAERQVVRCLANNNFTKDLVVWNVQVNNPENSFIREVQEMEVGILDYSKNKGMKNQIYTPAIQHLIEMIPTAPSMNPGIGQKLSNLVQIILERKPTTLHLWQDTTNVLGAIAGIICGVPKIVMSARSLPPYALPLNSFPHKGPNYYYNNRFVRLNYIDILQNERVYLSHNSQNGLEKYVEWLSGFKDKMLLLRNGFDLSEFRQAPNTTKNHRVFRIGVVFRFVDVKQPLLWLDVAKEVASKIQVPVIFTMVGDGPLLEEAMRYAKDIGLNDKIEFLGYRNDVIEILPSFDLFLLTSLIEGLPNVLIEAQAMGIPVVSTNAGGANETFIDGKSGHLVRTFEADDIANAVLKIANDKKFQESVSLHAAEHVNDSFSLQSMHHKLEEILFEGVE